LLIINLLLTNQSLKISKKLYMVFISTALVIQLAVIPAIITPEKYLNQSFSTLLIFTYHHIMILVSIVCGNKIERQSILKIEETYIIATFTASLGILIQYILYNNNILIGEISYYANRISFQFNFGDGSHAS